VSAMDRLPPFLELSFSGLFFSTPVPPVVFVSFSLFAAFFPPLNLDARGGASRSGDPFSIFFFHEEAADYEIPPDEYEDIFSFVGITRTIHEEGRTLSLKFVFLFAEIVRISPSRRLLTPLNYRISLLFADAAKVDLSSFLKRYSDS